MTGPDPTELPDPTAGSVAAIGVRELRNQVAAVVRRARAGERIAITVDGVPVAQLGPLTPPGRPDRADLVATGLVRPPATRHRPPAPPPLRMPVDVRIDPTLDDVRGR